MRTDSLLSLLWWTAIAVAFFWLMRRCGCGMMAHGDGRARSRDGDKDERLDRLRSVSGKPVDPVCGMEIEPAPAVGTRVVAGRTFFFCSQMCLDRLRRATQLFRRFPFRAPSYDMVDVPAGAGVAFDVRRCPVAEYFHKEGLSQVSVDAWCNLDVPLAKKWGARLERKGTLAQGAERCDFRWSVEGGR